MGWRKVLRKVYDCDSCGTTMLDPEFEQPITFPEGESLTAFDREFFEDIGWTYLSEFDAATHESQVRAYCPKCWHYCEAAPLGHMGVPGKAEDCTQPDCIEARGATV